MLHLECYIFRDLPENIWNVFVFLNHVKCSSQFTRISINSHGSRVNDQVSLRWLSILVITKLESETTCE